MLGKTKCGTRTDVYPLPNNPYDAARTPGASSSGDAAAVASGLSAIGIGSDSGGSLRFPAHCCGVATLKPTNGRVPSTGHFPRIIALSDTCTVIGPMARAASDLYAVMCAITGPDGCDASVVPMPLGDPAHVDLRGRQAAAYSDMPGVETTPETVAAVRVACDALRDAGVEVREDRPARIEEARDHRGLLGTRRIVLVAGMAADGRASPRDPEDVERHLFEWTAFEGRSIVSCTTTI